MVCSLDDNFLGTNALHPYKDFRAIPITPLYRTQDRNREGKKKKLFETKKQEQSIQFHIDE